MDKENAKISCSKMIKCPRCQGTGREPQLAVHDRWPDRPCQKCGGTGTIVIGEGQTCLPENV